MASILADSLKGLPFLQSINVADNNLTDDGLGPILEAIVQVKGLLEVNMSNNEIGPQAAAAMGDYLESPTCTLEKLVLQKADVDDFEGDRFIQALKKNTTVKEIDLTRYVIPSPLQNTNLNRILTLTNVTFSFVSFACFS